MAGGPKPDTPKDELKRRVARMRRDRELRAPFINEVYRLGMPHRGRIGSERGTPMTEDEIQDVLDTTLAETIDDYSSDMIATFTPPHEPWVHHVPTRALPTPQRQAVRDQIAAAVAFFWDDMEESTYYDAADECFHELSAGTMAVQIKEYGAAQPICYEPVATRNLLIDRGPDGAPDARFQEGKIERRHFQATYGRWVDWSKAPKELKTKWEAAKPDARFQLLDGIHRVWDKPGMTVWRRVVMLENEILYERIFDENGGETLIVARWRTETESAFGIGAAWWATAPARVLMELHALTLGQMHNVVDPAHAYSDPDGGANLEQGISAGDWLQLGEGFSVEKLNGDGEFQAAFYSREDLRMLIKRALYQDKPEQRGDTPPTATQWADESARAQQRFEIPRGKIIREWVVPIVRTHQWIRMQHGLFPEIKVGSTAIMLKPQSPQAKARSFEKVAKAERLLTATAAPALARTAEVAIDARATIENMKAEIGDELVIVRTEEGMQDVIQQAAGMMQGGEE